MQLISYNDLVARYGNRMAHVALAIIERSAKITKGNVVQFDRDRRLRFAFDAMREESLAA